IVAAVATPNVISALRTQRLRGTATDYASLLQRARIRAVEDNRFYGVQPDAAANATLVYVDMYPANPNGTSGGGLGAYFAGPPSDPMIPFASDVTIIAAAAVPNTNALVAQVLPAGAPAGIFQNLPPFFSPRGVPCWPQAGIPTPGCDIYNAGGNPVSYVTYFQSQSSNNIE